MTIPPETIEKIKLTSDIVEVIGEYVPLKKNGMDYFGLCPFHSEKTPSFSVAQDKQIFYCFGCGATGDVFEFLVKKEGIPFPEAVMRIAGQYGINVDGSEARVQGQVGSRVKGLGVRVKTEYAPEKSLPPGEIWQEKATKLVDWAHGCLLENPGKLRWLENRGIDIGLVKEFMLGWNPGEDGKDLYRSRESWGLEPAYKDDGKTKKRLWIPIGLIIPLIEDRVQGVEGSGVQVKIGRIRIRTERENPKYYVMPGSGMRCLVPGGARRAYVIIESELDAIMVYGKIRINKIGVIALGSAQRHPELETYQLLKKAPVILNALDFDQAGRKALIWWEERFPDNHRRWPVPVGKDPGDAFKAGVDIAEWIRAGLPEAWKWEIQGLGVRGKGPGGQELGARVQEKPETRNHEPGTGPSETVGRSDLLNEIKSGGTQEGSPLKEFAALVKSSSVVISVSPGQLKIKDAPSWARSNPDKSGRISELVFLNKEVRSFLMGLGSAELNSRNINTVMGERI